MRYSYGCLRPAPKQKKCIIQLKMSSVVPMNFNYCACAQWSKRMKKVA